MYPFATISPLRTAIASGPERTSKSLLSRSPSLPETARTETGSRSSSGSCGSPPLTTTVEELRARQEAQPRGELLARLAVRVYEEQHAVGRGIGVAGDRGADLESVGHCPSGEHHASPQDRHLAAERDGSDRERAEPDAVKDEEEAGTVGRVHGSGPSLAPSPVL